MTKTLVRQIGFIILIINLLFLFGCKSNFEEKYMKYDIDFKNMIFDIAVDSRDNVYVADKEFLYIYNREGSKVKTFTFNSIIITNLLVENNKIFAFDLFKNKFYEINSEGQIVDEKKLKIQFDEVIRMRKNSNDLYILGRIQKGQEGLHSEYELVKYDLGSDETEFINVDGIINFALYSKDSLIILARGIPNSFIIYNINERSVDNSYYVHSSIQNFDFSRKNSKVYYISDNKVYASDINKLDRPMLLDNTSDNVHLYDSKTAISDNYVYVLYGYEGPLERFTMNIERQDIKLIYYTSTNDMMGFDKKFEEANEGVTVMRMEGSSSADMARFILSLMSGDSSFDIFDLSSNAHSSYNILKNGIFLDLSCSDKIKSKIDNMIPAIKESAYYEEKIFGLPLSVWCEALYYNKELVEKHNINLYSIRTWEDYLEFAERIHKSNEAPGCEIIENKNAIYRIMLNQYLLNYNDVYCGEINFNTDEFKKVLETMKKINGSEGIRHALKIPGEAPGDQCLFWISIASDRPITDDAYFVSLPNIEDNENQVSPLSVAWAIINPHSKNKELAIKYLETMLEDYGKGHPFYPLKIFFNDKSLYDNISDVYFDNYVKLLSKSKVLMGYNLFGNVGHILGSYFHGAITVDEAAEQIHAKIVMMLTE